MTDTMASAAASATKSSSPNTTDARKASDAKRVLACGTCRKRKLKCDSKRPKCSTCARLGHPCEYDEVRKKSGPKRGYVKELEARLKQVENLLTTTQPNDGSPPQPAPLEQQSFAGAGGAGTGMNMFGTQAMEATPAPNGQQDAQMIDPTVDIAGGFGMGGMDDWNWDMISLGLEEPLPPQEVMDELYETYFDKVHPSLPMIHRPRFMASLNMPHNQRPPVCLRYIMWALACAMSPQYKTSAEQFYQKSRRYIEQDEMKGHGESFISVFHAQTWTLIGTFEFKTMYFPRAWMSSGSATRIAQLMGLHRQDRVGLDVKQTMAPPKDWIEREERRRTFWMAYCQDRYASIGTGWPMAIDERDILTNLPSSDEAFLTGRSEPTPALSDVLAGEGTSGLSSFAGVCLLASLFGRNLTHLHRPADDDNDHDLNGEFWKRHRGIDNILLNTSLSLPAHLRLPYGLNDPNIIFSNMNIHTSTICLHQAAIFKADKHRLPAQISAESKRRCIVAADQITNIMKMCSHLDLSLLNPFIAFCLYVAARVFVQYLKSKREDSTVRGSLTFLLSAMMALRNKNPLTESFLVQLDVDLEGSGLNIPSPLGPNRYANRPAGECPANTDAVKCSPLFEIRETQSLGQQARGLDSIVSSTGGQIDSNVDFGNLGASFMSHHKMQGGPSSLRPAQPPVQRVQSVSSGMNSPPQQHQQQSQQWDHSMGQPLTNLNNKSPQNDTNSNGSHSNQPTPASSSNHHSGSSHTSFSPSTEAIDNMQPFFGNEQPVPNEPFWKGGSFPGMLVASATATQQPQQRADGPGNSASQSEQNGFGNLFGGTGFTPGPTGFTPRPSGFTPGPSGESEGAWNEMYVQSSTAWGEG